MSIPVRDTIDHRLKNDVIADHSSGTTRRSSNINPPQTTNASSTDGHKNCQLSYPQKCIDSSQMLH